VRSGWVVTASAARPPAAPTDLDGAFARIREHGGRLTTAKREVARLLYATDEARTAEEIAEASAGLERSVVYRCLGRFEALGIVEHLHLGHGRAVYRRRGLETVPVVCTICGRATDLAADEVRALTDRVAARTGIVLDLAHFPLSGRCRACLDGEAATDR